MTVIEFLARNIVIRNFLDQFVCMVRLSNDSSLGYNIKLEAQKHSRETPLKFVELLCIVKGMGIFFSGLLTFFKELV